jgi:simple sugar transport system permease protein
MSATLRDLALRTRGPAATLGLTAIMAAIGSAILFRIAGADILAAFGALFDGAFGSERAILETLTRATPLILTGLAVSIAFRAKLWSIGAEGQLFAGAMAAYGMSLLVPGPGWIAVPLILAGGFAGGGAYGALAGILKVKRGVDEVMSTVMLNYLIMFALSFLLLNGVWSDPTSTFEQSPMVPAATDFPVLVEHSHLHLGFVVAILAAIAVEIVMERTAIGYDFKVLGENPRAFRAKMGDPAKLMVLVMAVSGGLAGLAGTGELFGVHHRLLPGISPGYGYGGIIVAILARYRPAGIVAASLLFGGLVSAAIRMQILTGVPSAASQVIQALLLLSYLVAGAIVRSRRHVA